MAKLTGSSNYKASEVSRLLVLVSKHLQLGKDEWERLASHFNVKRVRGEADRDYKSLRRKFKMLYSTRKPTGVQEMPPHIREAKLLKKAIDDKANVVVMDDGGDEDDQVVEEREIEPDFCFNFEGESFESERDNAGFTGITSTDSETKSSSSAVAGVRSTDETVNLSADTVSLPSTEGSCDFSALLETAAVRDGLDAFATSANLPPVAVRSSVRLRSAGIKKPFKSSSLASITCTTVNAPTGGTAGLAKKPVGRSRDQVEAQRYPKLVSASNRLGGLNLAEFRDTVGRKRASEDDDEEFIEASYAKAKRAGATKATAALKQRLGDLESSSKSMGGSILELMLVIREENERKAKTRRMEEEQRRRTELATREARYLTEKAEAEERRMQQKLESEERARRDKEEARARSQELVLLIGALTKKT